MMGWLANALMLLGSYKVGSKKRYGFVLQFVASALWVYIALYCDMHKQAGSVIVISTLFCCLYARNWWRWRKD